MDTSVPPSLGYMEILQQRKAATLLPMINDHRAPGSIIHSDMLAVYRRTLQLPPVAAHHTVNHKRNLLIQ